MELIADSNKDNESELEALGKEIETVSEEMVTLSSKSREINAKTTTLQSELEAAGKAFAEVRHNIQERSNRKAGLLHQVSALEQKLKEDTREAAIQGLLSHQQDFWVLAEDRLNALLKDLNTGLEGFDDNPKDPAEVIKFLRDEKENNRAFNHRSARTQQAMTHYSTCLRKLCEMRVDKAQIPPSEKHMRIDIIDRYFQDQQIVGLWS